MDKVCRRCGKVKDESNFPKDRKRNTLCRPCIAKRYRELRKLYPEQYRGYVRKHMRGIDQRTYEKMLLDQNYLCAICNQKGKTKWLAVDHDHKTGKIRGLLCDICNRALGMFKDDASLLTAAIMYLNRTKDRA